MTNTRELYELAKKHGVDYPAIVEGLNTSYVHEQRAMLARAMATEWNMRVNGIATTLAVSYHFVRSVIACDTSN